jgi:gamma-glutamyl phosphate reductase
MAEILFNDIEEKLSNLAIEELLDLEEKIMKVMKKKIREKKSEDWRKDFLDISVWAHLDDKSEVRVDKWKIETF